MNTMSRLLFFIPVSFVTMLLHYYVASRLTSGYALSTKLRRGLKGLFVAHALALPSLFLLMQFTGEGWADALQAVGWVSFGLFFLTLIYMGVKDLLYWIFVRVASLGDDHGVDNKDRRTFLTNILNGGVVLTALGTGGAAYINAKRLAEVKRVVVPIDGLPKALDGFKIAQISDIHVGPTIRFEEMKALSKAVNELGADVIAVTGDLVDGSVESLRDFVAPLGNLKAPHGIFFVTGNHEYYSGAESWCEHCDETLGWTVLLNENRIIEHKGAKLLMAGVTDYSAHRNLPAHTQDLDAAARFEGAVDLKILLAHQPVSAPESAKKGFDLQLSGHTHGGQFFPFTILIHLAQKFVVGLHRVEKMWLYVNPGTTYWGPPMRLGMDQEITLLELKAS